MFVFCNSEGKIWQKKCKGKIAEELVNPAYIWRDRFPPLKVRDSRLDLESRCKREIF